MSEPEVAYAGGLRVLLLEDSRFDAELLHENLLRSYPQAQLEVVQDEARFCAALAQERFDAILSDYELPSFSGAQALALARKLQPGTPFIFVSGVIGEDNAVEMLKRGATDYVSKSRLARLPVVLERALREVSERDARTLAEARLREADAIYVRVLDALRDYAVIVLDSAGCIRSWNRGARNIFGYETVEILGQYGSMLFTPEDQQAGVFEQELRLARERGSANDDRWLLRKDGLRLRAEGVLNPLTTEGGQPSGYCKIVRDTTQQYRNAQALRAAKVQAEQANQAKDRFLAVLSHELRTPLTPIVTATHLLERTAAVPAPQAHLLPMIRRNVALEARLIDDLLDHTAISAGKVSLKTSAVDMHQVVTRVVDMLADQVREGDLDLRQVFDAQQFVVHADEARMQQVVWNILRNAIKFTPPGGSILLRTSSQEGHFTLACVDSGIGIPTEALGRIFTPFEQVDREVSRRLGGLGLGLAIAHGLMVEHGGEIVAHSDGPGRGATFTLRLHTLDHPAVVAGVGTDEGELPSEVLESGGWRLLFVEDNLDAADTMVEMLTAYGYQVTHAATCAQALQSGREGEFDLVLTDLGLPDGSGIEVGSALSARLPVVALSGYGASADLQRSAMAGFAGHLVKPAEPQAIHQALQKALALYRGREQSQLRA